MLNCVAVVLLSICIAVPAAAAAAEWKEGTHYFRIVPAQPTTVAAGKVEVTEAFSYGCPACNAFLPVMKRLEDSLPPQAEIRYVPASFIPSEQWPLFQRAYYAAKLLDIDEQTHLAMFDAVWGTRELAIVDREGHRLIDPPPSIEDVAGFYARVADVTEEEFLNAAKSFSVALDMKRADQWIRACGVDRTPTIVVNGKYRLHAGSAGGTADKIIELVNWLVAREIGAGAAAKPQSASR
ncbi:MAG TPA: thiol:disulfide interchange protein DsbA/DsbL [Woeseiaceae bacterium]|nr:thiol:disulfide interchange protein DsbA/DsbL [Woeseiaceae bacterium]